MRRPIGFLFIFLLLVSCSPKEDEMKVDATQTIQAQVDDLVSEGVSATLIAMPTPTAVPLEDMSEEDLAMEIETSTNEAVYAADEAAQYAETASSDGELTQEELDELYSLFYWSIEELEQALYLMDLYYDLYDELIDDAIFLLEELDDELIALIDYSQEMIAYLDEFALILARGGQVLHENLGDFHTLIEDLPGRITEISDQLPEWMGSRKSELESLAADALAVAPNDIAGTRREAIAQVKDYISGLSTAIGDGVFSFSELENLSQLGANAAASVGKFGGEFAGVSDMINGLTGSFARGQLPQINSGLGSLQGAIPSIR